MIKNTRKNNKKNKTAFSVIEILVAIAILLVVGGVSVTSFLNWRSEKNIDSAADITLSVLEEARNLTINAYGGNQFGVYFGSDDRLVRFTGTTYNAGDISNVITLLPRNEIIATSTKGALIVFQKFTGSAGGAGTIVLTDKNNASTTRTMVIDNSGIVSIKK